MEAGFWNSVSPSLLSKAGWAWQEGVLGPGARLVELCSVRESPGWEPSQLPLSCLLIQLYLTLGISASSGAGVLSVTGH